MSYIKTKSNRISKATINVTNLLTATIAIRVATYGINIIKAKEKKRKMLRRGMRKKIKIVKRKKK